MRDKSTLTLIALCLLATGAGRFTLCRAVRALAAPAPSASPIDPELRRLWEAGAAAAAKGDFAASDKALRAGLANAQARGDQNWQALFLRGLGANAASRSQFDAADAFFRDALSRFETLDNKAGIAHTLTEMGNLSAGRGQFPQALKQYQRALDLRQRIGPPKDVADLLNNMGNVYAEAGDLVTALHYYQDALERRTRLRDAPGLAATHTCLGNVYLEQGQFTMALDHLTQALDLQQQLGNKADLAGIFGSLGGLYAELGQFDQAEACFKQAQKLQEQPPPGDPRDLAQTIDNLGNVYEQEGQLDAALLMHTDALHRLKALNIPPDIAAALDNRGGLYQRLGQLAESQGQVDKARRQFESAVDDHTQALTIAEQLGNPQEIAGIHGNIGVAYTRLKQFDHALAHLKQALATQETLPNEQDMARTLHNLAGVYEQQGRLDTAQATYRQAVRHAEAVSAQVSDPSQIGAYQQAYEGDLYARYAALLLRRGRPAEALAMLERGRAQGLARQLTQSRAELSAFLSKEDAAKLAERAQALTTAGKLLYAASTRTEPPQEAPAHRAWEQQRADAKQRCEAASRQLSFFREGLFTRYPAYRQVEGQQPPSPAQLTSLAVRHPDTLFLEWGIVDEKTALLFALSRKDGLKIFTLPVGQTKLTALAKRWYTRLISRSLEEPPAATEMFRAALGRVEQAGLLNPKRYARLVLVGDGPLLSLPWAALRDSNGKRLIERFPLSTSVSLGVLTWPPNSRRPTASLLVAADPLGGVQKPLQVASRRGFASLRDGLGPLDFAPEEARQVKGQFSGAVELIGPQAREGEVKRQMEQYALLHFATHGILDERDGLRSWLLLAPEPAESAEDGRLEAREIVGLRLSAKLAVLSACQTGLGQRSGGEGLLGLAWAFRAAGCPSVVASLWSVNDQATGKLMADFYRRLKAGEHKDAALREAVREVRKDPLHRHPYFWAAFQVIGETAPLALPR